MTNESAVQFETDSRIHMGLAVGTLQEFLVTARWDHDRARDTLQTHLGSVVADLPADALGTVGVVDETSCRKWGEHTPGVQRPYLGCVGKVDSGIVTVHLGVARGPSRRCSTRSCTYRRRGTLTATGAGTRASRTTSSTGRSGGWRWTSGCG